MILSGTLHWLVSQSIFLVSIDFWYAHDRELPRYDRSMEPLKTLGFSPIAIISVIILGIAMVVSILAFGFIPYRRGMPLAGANSMAISAACHVKDEDKPAFKELQWGTVSKSFDGIGHCAFSSKPVTPPVKGEVYS